MVGAWLGCYNKDGGYLAIFHTDLENPMEWSQLGQTDCISKRI
jgi:hypothetical protein